MLVIIRNTFTASVAKSTRLCDSLFTLSDQTFGPLELPLPLGILRGVNL
jgi:hypothetical protein